MPTLEFYAKKTGRGVSRALQTSIDLTELFITKETS